MLYEYISDLNSKLLNNYYLQLNITDNIYINNLSKINYLLFSKVQDLYLISSIYKLYINNLLKQLKSFSHISLINNNFSLINNNANFPKNIMNLINYDNQINQTKYNNNIN